MRKARVHSGRATCARCGCPKPTSVGLVADAGQFFEAVTPAQAVAAAHVVMRRCVEATGKDSVTVKFGRRRVAFIGGSPAAAVAGSCCFAMADLFLAFAACMLTAFCSLGDMVFSLRGLPIGGVLSKIASSCVLGLEEEAWELSPQRRASLGFAATSPCWNQEVARGRYVDDIFWASGVYCHACLCVAVERTYSVKFDVEQQSCVIQWLDIRFDTLRHTWRMKEKAWRISPPWALSDRAAVSLLRGRFSRWAEVPLDDGMWCEALISVLIGFRDSGWVCKRARGVAFRALPAVHPDRRRMLSRAVRAVWAQAGGR